MSSDLKITNIKHADSSSNNLVLGSDGTTTVNGALTASGGIKVADGGTIGSASDTDAISISSSGYVIDSARPYFYVYGNSGSNAIADDNRIPFNQEFYDNGNHWDTSNYYFTTPVAGVYYFHFQLYHYHTTNSFNWRIVSHDNTDSDLTVIGIVRRAAPVGNNEIYSCVAITYVPVNRRISVYNQKGSDSRIYLGNATHTTFQGGLIG